MLIHKNIVAYRCRRGLLELDKILVPFCQNHYANLCEADKKSFVSILECSDPQLQSWFFMNPEEAPSIIKLIINKMGLA